MDWKQIYSLPRLVTLDSYSRSFQYKILINVLYLNKNLFTFRKSTSLLWPFCKLYDKTVLHLFYECDVVQNLWNELDLFSENDFTLFDLTPQAPFLRFLNVDSKPLLIQNHLLLIFKKYIYNSRRSESLIIKSLIRKITKAKNIEKKIWMNNEKKTRENVQEKMPASWKCFEDQNFFIFYLIHPMSRGEVGKGGGLRRGNRQKEWVVEDFFFFFCLFVNYSL